jgi:aryl-alcohol dehydrogenase-like predicted oxidoreductase
MQAAAWVTADHVGEGAAAVDPEVPAPPFPRFASAVCDHARLTCSGAFVARRRSGVYILAAGRMENSTMEMARFGKTGMKVSRLCLGCMTYGSTKWRDWVLDEEASRPFIREAIERGINFFDTADMYSVGASEEVLGRALKEYAKRDEVVVATKVFNPMGPGPNARGLSRKHITEAIDASLKRLGMDYVDLYQIHRFDPETPIEETVEALNDVVRAGKALYVGASSMWTWQFARMISVARERGLAEFVSMQNFYNLVYREEEREMMKFCADQGIAVIPWSPLARGYLAREGAVALGEGASTVRGRTDAYPRTLQLGSRQDEAIRRRVGEAADKFGVKPAVIALAWVLSKPYVTAPIVGVSKPHHLADAVAALALKLDARTIAKLEEPYHPKEVVGHQ